MSDREARDYLHGLDDKVAACLGDHHPWPQIKPGKLPRGVSARPQADGCFQIRVTCPSCGRVRTKTTFPKGVYDRGAKWEYEKGPQAPKGLGLSRYDYTGELWRRVSEDLQRPSPDEYRGTPRIPRAEFREPPR